MKNREEVEAFVVERLKATRPKARKITLEGKTNLIESGVVDSFAFLELLTEVEARFGLQIDAGDYEFETFTTLGGFCDAIAAAG